MRVAVRRRRGVHRQTTRMGRCLRKHHAAAAAALVAAVDSAKGTWIVVAGDSVQVRTLVVLVLVLVVASDIRYTATRGVRNHADATTCLTS